MADVETKSPKEGKSKASAETRGAFDSMFGELLPTQSGWLPLGPDGTPSGPATLLPPAPGVVACPVLRAPDPPPPGHDVLTSLAGAPLIAPLNGSADRRFEAEPSVPPVSTRAKENKK